MGRRLLIWAPRFVFVWLFFVPFSTLFKMLVYKSIGWGSFFFSFGPPLIFMYLGLVVWIGWWGQIIGKSQEHFIRVFYRVLFRVLV